MEDRQTYEIKDICLGIYEGPHATPKVAKTGGIYLGIPALTSTGHINYDNIRYISDEDMPIWTKRVTPQEGDIVFTNEATLNLYAVIPPHFYGCLGRRLGLIRPNKDLVDVNYLFYYFFSPEWRETISKNKVSGATVERILMTKFPHFPISLPSLSTQQKISKILSTIDAKIENNRKINDNLEQQARELFKSWFINSPQESWKEKSLSDYFNVITGKKDANYSTPEGAYPFFTCSQDILKAPSYSFDGHAILVAGNGDFNVKRYIGKFEAYQRTYVLIPHEEKFHAFLYLMIDYYLPEITGGSRGSVIKFITKGNIANFRFRVPQNNIDDQLKKLNDIYKIIDCNLEESSRLTKMRDTLLPKLMSGELKINEIDC